MIQSTICLLFRALNLRALAAQVQGVLGFNSQRLMSQESYKHNCGSLYNSKQIIPEMNLSCDYLTTVTHHAMLFTEVQQSVYFSVH